MYSFILLLPLTLVATEIYFEDISIPDYDFTFFESKDIRGNFLRNRKKNSENSKKIQQLDKYLPNNTLYVDEIPHYAVIKNNSKVNSIETEFRNLIGMKGLKYSYKRDTFWRTWRVVNFSGNSKVIWYRCENSVNFTYCNNGGYWGIEEKPPPCPYELFSIPKDNQLCAVYIDQYYNATNSCNSEINLSEFTESCSNPVVTVWRVEKTYDVKVPERFPHVICGGRESCTITTLYKISTDHISFRIVNASNTVIFSRIMKPGKNYACISDCGEMDPYTKNIAIATKEPLLVNLLGKKKRDYTKHALFGKKKRENKHGSTNSKNLLFDSEARRSSLVKDEFDDDYLR